jgi:hypothetical protein
LSHGADRIYFAASNLTVRGQERCGLTGAKIMGNKEQKSNKEAKKKPALTPKEKKAVKKAKKEQRNRSV